MKAASLFSGRNCFSGSSWHFFWAAFSVLVKHQLLLWLQLILIKLPGGRSSTFRAYLLKSQLIPDDLARDSVLNFQLLAFTAMSEYFLFPTECSMYSAKWHHTWFAVIHPVTTPIHLGLCRLDLHFDCSISDVCACILILMNFSVLILPFLLWAPSAKFITWQGSKILSTHLVPS